MIKVAVAAGMAFAIISSGAMATDISIPSAGVIDVPAPSGWDGGYVGGTIGYGPGTLTQTGIGSFIFGGYGSAENYSDSLSFSGLFFGGQAGYNTTVTPNVVVGVEADINKTNESGTVTVDFGEGGIATRSTTLNWTGAFTGHVGYDMGAFMPYVLGGLAIANNTQAFTDVESELGDLSASATHVGYTLGAGFAVKLSQQISGFVEARYADYGIATYNFTNGGSTVGVSASLTDTTVRTGVNFHFN